ncbi:MAG: RHS repeat-associated core domain-containing protein, partial [Fimbriimonadales bacterium]
WRAWSDSSTLTWRPTSNHFTWNGAYGYAYVPFTGLYHVGAREYDPRTARWLQRDPIDVASGDPNLYRYCLNDPVNLADPSGLDLWQWYLSGMGGLSQWVDQNLMFGVTERFGTTAGRYDCGQASGWQLAWDATLWGGALLLAGFSAVVPGDEVVLGGAATVKTAASQGVRSTVRGGAGLKLPELGRKLDYIFGKASGDPHSVRRSRALQQELQRIGINDTPENREYLTAHLTWVLNDPTNIREVQRNGRIVRESLLMGPKGGCKLETIWEGDKLITVIIKAGR